MGKVKPSKKQAKFSKNIQTVRLKKNARVVEYSPTAQLADENFIARAIWDCLKDNDPKGVLEVIEAHLEAVNRLQTVYHQTTPRVILHQLPKEKNPTLRTLARTVHKIPTISLPECYVAS